MCTKFGGLGIGSFRLILGRDIDTDRQTDMQQADRHYLEPNATELTVFSTSDVTISASPAIYSSPLDCTVDDSLHLFFDNEKQL